MIRSFAQALYNYLKTKHPSLPPFSYQLGMQSTDSLIFTNNRYNGVKYFDDNYHYISYVIRLYSPKMNHSLQWDLCVELENTLKSLSGWKCFVNQDDYIVDSVSLNGLQGVDYRLNTLDLESYNDSSQCYQLTIDLILRKENHEKNK